MGPYRIGDVAAERYDVRERFGTSPLYWTYGAFDQEEESPVTLRVVRQTILPRSRDHRTFAERLAPLRSLVTPSIATLLGVERDEGKSIIISQLCDGLSLKTMLDIRRVESRAFSAVETLSVLSAVAEALGEGADASIHGDLRPPHILLHDKSLVLEAMGIAAALPQEETVRALENDPEASGYLAPEILAGHRGDQRADVYALAMITGELLTGRMPPVQEAGLEEFLRHLPPLADEILRRCLSQDPKKRDESPSDLVEALSAILGAETWKCAREPLTMPKDPNILVEPASDGTIPMISPLALTEGLPKDPSIPVLPAPDGTIPMAYPLQLNPSHLNETPHDADATVETTAAVVERAVAALEKEEEPQTTGEEEDPPTIVSKANHETPVEKDPWKPAAPTTEGTQQITADMFESVDDDDDSFTNDLRSEGASERRSPSGAAGHSPEMSKDPRVAVTPDSSGTQQITADMFEPLDEDDDGEPRHPKGQSFDLDPKLVRAARRLDKEKAGPDEPTATPEPHALAVAAQSDEDLEQQSPAPWMTSEGEELRTEVQRAPPKHLNALPLEPEPANNNPPAALLRGSLGPIQVRVAGGERSRAVSLGTSTHTPEEPGDLPAVLVDQALTEAFGPAVVPPEPTYKFQRADALLRPAEEEPPPSPKSTRAPSPTPSRPSTPPWWVWALVVAILGASAIIFGFALRMIVQ